MPYLQAAQSLPGPLKRALSALPTPAPILPDFGVPLQLVHAEDVATALRAGVVGRGSPGIYNLAARGEVTMSDIAERAWMAQRQGPEGSDRRDLSAAGANADGSRSRRVAARASDPGRHGHRPRPARASLAPRPRCAGDAVRDGGRRQGRRACSRSARSSRPCRKVAMSENDGGRESITAEGLDALRAEVEELEGTGRARMAARIKAARELGDLKENADYHIAKEDQAHLETRIKRLRQRLNNAEVVERRRGRAASSPSAGPPRSSTSQRQGRRPGPSSARPRRVWPMGGSRPSRRSAGPCATARSARRSRSRPPAGGSRS